MERVLALPGEQPIAVPYSVLSETRVANTERSVGRVVVFWAPGQSSPWEPPISPRQWMWAAPSRSTPWSRERR